MSIVGEAFVLIRPETAGFTTQMESELSGKSGVFGSIGTKLGLAAVAAAGTALVGIGEHFAVARHTIEQQTGATGALLERLFNNVVTTSKNVPSSLADVTKAVDILHQRVAATGPALNAMATQQLYLSKITGIDVTQNVQALTSILIKYGISLQDLKPKTDEIFRASQATGDSFEQLTALLGRGGAALQQYGFNFDQSTAFIAKFAQSAGPNATRVLFALTTGFSKLAKAGEDPRAALMKLNAELTNSKTRAQGFIDATHIFSSRGGLELARALANGALNFHSLLTEISNGKGGVTEVGQATLSLGDNFRRLRNEILADLQPIASAVYNFANKVMVDAIHGVRTATKAIQEAWAFMLAGFEHPETKLVPALSGFQTFFLRVGAVVHAASSDIKQAWTGLFAGLTNAVNPRSGLFGIANTFAQIGADIRGVIAAAVPILEGFGKAVARAFGALVDFVRANPVPVLTAVGIALGAIAASSIASGIGAVVDSMKALFLVTSEENTALLANPFVLAAVALAALGGAFAYAYQHSATFRVDVQKVAGVVEQIASTVAKLGREIITAIGGIDFGSIFNRLVGVVKPVLAPIVELGGALIHLGQTGFPVVRTGVELLVGGAIKLAPVLLGVVGAVLIAAHGLAEVLAPAIRVAAVIADELAKHMNTLKPVILAAAGAFLAFKAVEFAKAGITGLLSIVETGRIKLLYLGDSVRSAWATFRGFPDTARLKLMYFKDGLDNMLTSIKAAPGKMAEFFKGLGSAGAGALDSARLKLLYLKDGVGNLLNSMKSSAGTVGKFFKDFTQSATDSARLKLLYLKDGVKGLLDSMKSRAGDVATFFKNLGGEAALAAKLKIEQLKTAISGIGTAMKDGGSKALEFGKNMLTAALNTSKQTVALVANKAASIAGAAATKIMSAAQAVLDAVLDANPIFLVVAALAAIGLAFYEAYKHITPFREAVQAVGRFAEAAGKLIVHGLGAAFDWIKSHWQLLGAILLGPFGIALLLIKDFGPKMLGYVEAAFHSVVDFFTTVPGMILAALGALAATLIQWIGDGFTAAVAALPSLATALLDWYVKLPLFILGKLGDAATWLVGTGSKALHGLLMGVEHGAVAVWDWFKKLGEFVIKYVGGAELWLLGKGKDILTGLLHGIVAGAAAVWSWFASLGRNVVSKVGDVLGTLLKKGEDLLTGLLHGILHGAIAVWDWLKKVGPNALHNIGNMLTALVHAGEDLIKGLINGIEKEAGNLWGKLEGIGKKVIHTITHPWEVLSPSRVMMQNGQYLIQGATIGVTQAAPGLYTALDGIATKALTHGDLSPVGTHMTKQLGNAIDAGKGEVVGKFAGLNAAIGSVHLASPSLTLTQTAAQMRAAFTALLSEVTRFGTAFRTGFTEVVASAATFDATAARLRQQFGTLTPVVRSTETAITLFAPAVRVGETALMLMHQATTQLRTGLLQLVAAVRSEDVAFAAVTRLLTIGSTSLKAVTQGYKDLLDQLTLYDTTLRSETADLDLNTQSLLTNNATLQTFLSNLQTSVGAVRQFVAALVSIPKQIPLNIVSNISAAMGWVQSYIGELNAVPRNITTTFNIVPVTNTSSIIANLNQTQQLVNSHPITVKTQAHVTGGSFYDDFAKAGRTLSRLIGEGLNAAGSPSILLNVGPTSTSAAAQGLFVSQAFTDGVINGLASSDVVTASNALAQSMIDSTNSTLGIQSPSTVGISIGQNFVNAIAAGVSSGTNGIGSSVSLIVRTMKQNVPPDLGTFFLEQMMQGFGDQSIVSQAINSLNQAFGAAQQAAANAAGGANSIVSAALSALPDPATLLGDFAKNITTASHGVDSALKKYHAGYEQLQDDLAGIPKLHSDAVAALNAVAGPLAAYNAAVASGNKTAISAAKHVLTGAESAAKSALRKLDSAETRVTKDKGNIAEDATALAKAKHALQTAGDASTLIKSIRAATAESRGFEASLKKLAHEGLGKLAEVLAQQGPDQAAKLAKQLASKPALAKTLQAAIAQADAFSTGYTKFLNDTFGPKVTNIAHNIGKQVGKAIHTGVGTFGAGGAGVNLGGPGPIAIGAPSAPAPILPSSLTVGGVSQAVVQPQPINNQLNLSLDIEMPDGKHYTADVPVVTSTKSKSHLHAKVKARAST